ncbi:MAG TPA: S1/P1 nuclease [Pyrinomonadaceae bacterium]|jgi:hypothetical protein
MKRKLLPVSILVLALLLPQTALAWNSTGHQLVARIAWENMTPTARENVVALLLAAPKDACLRNLFSKDSRPLEIRQREFFMLASTWPDIVRPGENDTRPCTRFHQRDWHFINFFWSGTSADANDPPRDVTNIKMKEINAVERLRLFRPFVVSSMPKAERATDLAWILHLVGDIHQPLHTSARVTSRPDERQGDQGGNLFLLNSQKLHGYWDGIVDLSVRRKTGERDQAYLERVAAMIMAEHPQSALSSRIQPGQFEAWAREGLATTKSSVYPASLKRGQTPGEEYRRQAFEISKEAIALGGYRLAQLLNQLFGS